MEAFVFTYCTWGSFGSVLQSVGLKAALSELGVSSEIVINEPRPVFRDKPILSGGIRRAPSRVFDRIIRAERRASFERGSAFIAENLDVRYLPESGDVFEGRVTADVYIAGSDQIWNPEICDPAFFLDLVPEGKRRISYAASMGNTRIPERNREKISNSLKRFDSISVREAACKAVLRELTDTEIEVNIDPVFLMSEERWKKLEKPCGIDRPYILLYAIYWDPALNKEVRKLQRRTGLPVLTLAGHLNRCCGSRRIYNAGPAEFLWLIDHAEYVVTSSFHAAAMSAIFGKRCAPVVNPASPSRITNLYELLGLPMTGISELDAPVTGGDTEAVHMRIAEERARGMDYLKEAIEKP